jgi:hypothetical protein
MKKITGLSAALCLLFLGSWIASAQEAADEIMAPPKVLVIMREYVKPGKAGSLHEKSESGFIRAMTAAKWPTHYFAADSLSGPSRALFFVGYPSFEAWEKDNLATQKNATLSAGLDRASIADGELLSSYDSSAYAYREDLSLRPASVSIREKRYFEITRFVVRPGHMHEWDSLVKMYTSGFEKAVPNAHWATFQSMYGADNGGVFLVFNPMKSLAEVDQSMGDDKKFMSTMNESERKKLSELTASCIESSQTNLFVFNPKISYPSEEWIKADPFWKPKAAAPGKEREANPAQ